MKKYEATREIFNACNGKYNFDPSFPEEIETDDIVAYLTGVYAGRLPEYNFDTHADGSLVYTFKPPVYDRYIFNEL